LTKVNDASLDFRDFLNRFQHSNSIYALFGLLVKVNFPLVMEMLSQRNTPM